MARREVRGGGTCCISFTFAVLGRHFVTVWVAGRGTGVVGGGWDEDVRGGVGEEVVGRCGRGKSVCTAGGGDGKRGVSGEGGEG